MFVSWHFYVDADGVELFEQELRAAGERPEAALRYLIRLHKILKVDFEDTGAPDCPLADSVVAAGIRCLAARVSGEMHGLLYAYAKDETGDPDGIAIALRVYRSIERTVPQDDIEVARARLRSWSNRR